MPLEVVGDVYRLHQAANGSGAVTMHVGKFDMTIPRRRWLLSALEHVSWRHDHTIAALNIPGTPIETLISLPTSWPHLWHPEGLTFPAWRTLTLPFFCLPAWWFVGRGLDALVRRRSLHWIAYLAGAILCLLCLTALVGFQFGLSASERQDMGWVILGFAFWSLAFGVLPCAWFHDWRTRRTSAASPSSPEQL